jgi:hypothetical protein
MYFGTLSSLDESGFTPWSNKYPSKVWSFLLVAIVGGSGGTTAMAVLRFRGVKTGDRNVAFIRKSFWSRTSKAACGSSMAMECLPLGVRFGGAYRKGVIDSVPGVEIWW